MWITVAGKTDVGKRRQSNEDMCLTVNLTTTPSLGRYPIGSKGVLLGVFDGMGGAVGGEVASHLAAKTVRDFFVQPSVLPSSVNTAPEDAEGSRLVRALNAACATVYDKSRVEKELRGMGTTATIAYVQKTRVVIGHVGDSRAYLLRQGVLTQITRDQSLVQDLFDAGQITKAQMTTHHMKNVITQALGTTSHVVPEVRHVPLKTGDVLLLCSDGLTNMVSDESLVLLADTHKKPQALAQELIAAANAAGGDDNISVVVSRFE